MGGVEELKIPPVLTKICKSINIVTRYSFAAELRFGSTDVKSAGVLALYNKGQQDSGAVCSTGFGQKEAGRW